MKLHTILRLVLAAFAFITIHAVMAAPATVHITGRLLEVNGQTEVPRGLMGVHADTQLTTERARDWGIDGFRQIHFGPGSSLVATDKEGRLREPFKDMAVVIDCQGDRYAAATVLTKPDYEAFFKRIGTEYAAKCAALGWNGYAEFWNEPYLNWAERSRKNYDPKYYDVTQASEDGPVTIKGWDTPLRYLKWRRLWAQNPQGKIVHLVPVPSGAKPGDTFTHRSELYFMPKEEVTYTVVEKWDVYDPTAVSFWSAKQNLDFYLWMFRPWAKAIKETNPAVTVLAGWDYQMNGEDWQVWKILYQPLIDEAVEYMDGITEHHYGSDTRKNAATYEVAVGYAMAEHGKWLRCYNTETAGCVDPAVPGNRHGNATPYGAFNYGLRDIVELCYRCPGKAMSRAAHGSLKPGWGGGGDEFLFKLLKEFRGKLVHATSDDLNIWPTASFNAAQSSLVIVLFNDHPSDRTITLRADAPAGTRLTSGRLTWVEPTKPEDPLAFHTCELSAAGDRFSGEIQLPRQSGAKVAFQVEGAVAGKPALSRRQFFARGILKEVKPGAPVDFTVKLDPSLLERAESARVKAVLENVRDGNAAVQINGARLQFPDYNWITEVAVDPKLLKEQNRLTFTAAGEGYRVDVVSVVVDRVVP